MINVILLHGKNETPESFWLPYAKRELEKRGYKVWAPHLPNSEDPDIKISLEFVVSKGTFTEETILIGRSAGCPLILAILEKLNVKVKQAILVAGFITPLPGGANKILQPKYNWKKIKNNVKEIVFINSDDDPWGCDDKQGRLMLDRIGGLLIIPKGEGHFGSDTFDQPYKEFPLLIRLIH